MILFKKFLLIDIDIPGMLQFPKENSLRFIYIPLVFVLAQLFSYGLWRKRRRSSLNQVSTAAMSKLLKAIRKQYFSPRRNGSLDLNKHLIAAYFVNPGDLVIDVGAHIGRYTTYYSSLVNEKGEVQAFEAHPLIFSELKRRVTQLGNVRCYHFAVSKESDQHIEMKVYPNDITQECATIEPLLMNSERMPGDTKLISVTTRKLDEILDEKERKLCSLIKIDVEGHEHAVIEGAKRLISKDKPIIIYEYGFSSGNFEPKTIGQLKKMNYLSYDCKSLQRVDEGYSIAITDLVAIPKDKQLEFEAFTSLLAKK